MTIYFDLDGVLTDFEKKCKDENCFNKNGRPNWEKIDSLGTVFWTDMDWLPGAKSFFEKTSSFAVEVGWKIKVLSAIHSQAGKQGKTEWCQKNLGLSKSNIDIVPKRTNKSKYANPTSILIDDSKDVVDSFIYSGGMAIFHNNQVSAEKKIDCLIEAVNELKKTSNMEILNNSSEIMKALLTYLFKKNNIEDMLDFGFSEAYKATINFIHRNPEMFSHNKTTAELNDKYKSVIPLYLEQQQENDEPYSVCEASEPETSNDELIEVIDNSWTYSFVMLKRENLKADFWNKRLFEKLISHLNENNISISKINPIDAAAILMFGYLSYMLYSFLETTAEK